MTEDARAHKELLRAQVLSRRAQRTAAECRQAGTAIAAHGRTAWSAARTVAAYAEVGDEPPTLPLLDTLRLAGVAVLLPVIVGETLDWAAYSGAAQLRPGRLGIPEPSGPTLGIDALTGADVIVVPALAVDRYGNRLGRGRGYYDRALAGISAAVVAVVYDDEVLTAVPHEPHDRRVDRALCPAGAIELSDRQ